jgi:uncharacterized protein (UPF0303 family)
MEYLYTEQAWSETLKEQESLLQYTSFTRDQALELGNLIVKFAKEKYNSAVAIRIIEEETVIFSYRMEGTVRDADWWMDHKVLGARYVGMSSLRALVASKYHEFDLDWKAWEHNVLGGCIPVFRKGGGRPFAYVVISGLDHYDDHMLIANAMAAQLGITIPQISRTAN